MRRILTFAAAVLLSLSAWGQTRTVSGTVLDAQQQPLVGAAVILSGTTNGEVTGLDGGFRSASPPGM